MTSRADIAKTTTKMKHLIALKSAGCAMKESAYRELLKSEDKSGYLLSLAQTIPQSARSSKVFADLAIDFELVDAQLWSHVFVTYPLGVELFNLVRLLNLRGWFVKAFRKEPKLRRIIVEIWNSCLFHLAEHESGEVVAAVHEFDFPHLLKIPQLVKLFLKLEQFSTALLVAIKSKLFDRNILMNEIIARKTVVQLLEIARKEQPVVGKFI